jgi:subtilisin family serine protease
VAAAGNQGRVGGSCITKDPWVIPVVSIDRAGRPTNECNLSASIGLRGLAAPGQDVPSVSSGGEPARFSGTSAACPLVTGAAALLWSEYPSMTAAQIKEALTGGRRQRSIVPPAMDAWGAFETLGAS